MPRMPVVLVASAIVASCASTPEPLPVALNAASPEAPVAPPVPPLEAFESGPRNLDEPILSPPDEQEKEDHGIDDHEGHDHEVDDHGDHHP